jgi:hypothetical protein
VARIDAADNLLAGFTPSTLQQNIKVSQPGFGSEPIILILVTIAELS